ncbi:MAG: c-type cytochrome [Chlamydiae bacterium]|nr:c-type cytochrome [Chlamydiota bacterium]MBI3265939.1 c-type cytochrome [Chlamydiota bacterium]
MDEIVRNSRIEEGRILFQKTGCINCHLFENKGKPFGTSLDKLRQTNPGFARAWIKNPQAMKSGVKMPTPKLDDDQILSLLYYLYQEN